MQFLFFLVLLIVIKNTDAITFQVRAGTRMCFYEEVHLNQEISGIYRAAPGYLQYVDFYLIEPDGGQKDSIIARESGEFHTIASVSGEHSFCFINRLVEGIKHDNKFSRTISFQYYTGNRSKELQKSVRKETLKPFELELYFIEDDLRKIREEYEYFGLKQRELNEATSTLSSRTLKLKLFSIVFVILFIYLEVRHMKKYFRNKRLID